MIGRMIREGAIKVLMEEFEYDLDKRYGFANYKYRDNREAFEKLEERVEKLEEQLKAEKK